MHIITEDVIDGTTKTPMIPGVDNGNQQAVEFQKAENHSETSGSWSDFAITIEDRTTKLEKTVKLTQANEKMNRKSIDEIEEKANVSNTKGEDAKGPLRAEFKTTNEHLNTKCHCVHVGRFTGGLEQFDEVTNMAKDFKKREEFEDELEGRVRMIEAKFDSWSPCLNPTNRTARPQPTQRPDTPLRRNRHSKKEPG